LVHRIYLLKIPYYRGFIGFSGMTKYNEHVNAHLHILSFDQVVSDAKKRNQVFLDILRENANS